MAAVTICSDFGAQENRVSHCFHCLPICLPWSDGIRCHDLSFWTMSFKPTFSLSSFTFIKRLFSHLLSAIRVVSSAYLRLLIFSPSNLDSSLCFIQPSISHDVLCIVCCSMSGSNCCFLTCIQVSQEAGQVVWYSHLFKNFPQFVVMHTVKGFSVVYEADVFLEFSCFFFMYI